ncbi:hypothetical protein [Thiolapillus sp.]|uniref:hypothetical protein n=3 Tax=Thiolapillus sp. TaxID=2017437 RepID=UPI0025E2AB18|nr:hypothetical protein [Thiolapillus sp.]
MTRTAGAPIGCQRPSRFWGLGCPKIFHEGEDTLATGSGLRVPGHAMMLSLPTQQAWAADFAEIRTFFNSL